MGDQSVLALKKNIMVEKSIMEARVTGASDFTVSSYVKWGNKNTDLVGLFED